jgi:hypothetical protein
MRLLRTLLPIAFTCSFTAAAYAQIGIYASGESTHASTSDTSSASSSAWFGGFNAGVYDEFHHFGPVHLGADARGSFVIGKDANDRAFLFGPRLAVKPPVLPIKPYIVGNIGVGGSIPKGMPGSGITFHYNNKLEYGVLGGVEYTVLPRVDWRVIEVGYERRSGTYNADPVSLFNLATGIVIRVW